MHMQVKYGELPGWPPHVQGWGRSTRIFLLGLTEIWQGIGTVQQLQQP